MIQICVQSWAVWLEDALKKISIGMLSQKDIVMFIHHPVSFREGKNERF
jgi:hypothetical protein